MKSTIKDIANDTNLSLATISKYLNGKKISSENTEKIRVSIKKLDFNPNKSAQALRSQKSKTIGIILEGLGNYFWSSIVSYVEETLRLNNYSTIVCSFPTTDNPENNSFPLLFSNQIDGIILIPPQSYNYYSINSITSRNIPMITIDIPIENTPIYCVTSTNFKGGYEATEYLIHKGHKKIGVIAGEPNSYTIKERIQGYLSAHKDYNITIHPEFISYGDFTPFSGRSQFNNIMKLSDPPTALIPFGYDIGLGVLIEASSLGYQIGKNISILCFDDDELFEAINPPITALAQDLRSIGTKAVNILLDQIKNEEPFSSPQIIMVDTMLIERSSVKTLC